MKRIIIEFIFCAVCFSLGFFIHAMQKSTDKVIIKQGEIRYNTIDADPSAMTDSDKTDALTRFYRDVPTIDIAHVKGEEYKMTAGLYLRSWNRSVQISIPKPKNMIIGNILFDSHLNVGGMVQYFRMFDNAGIGGGVGATAYDQFLTAGAVFTW